MCRASSARCVFLAALALATSASLTVAQPGWYELHDSQARRILPSDAAEPPRVQVEAPSPDGLQLIVELPGFTLVALQREAGPFTRIDWPDASLQGAVGSPQLPLVRRLFLAPPGADVTATAITGPATRIALADRGLPPAIIPVQPPVPKLPGAADAMLFQFDAPAYASTTPTPAQRVSVTPVGIVRGQHLWLLEVYPVSYQPSDGLLHVWPSIDVNLTFVGRQPWPQPRTVAPELIGAVLNPEPLLNAPVAGANYLILAAQAFAGQLGAFEAAKIADGYDVTTVVIPPGTNRTTIKQHVTDRWNTADEPAYVLLVGDTDTIPHWTGGGAGTPATDLPYACMDGTTDWMPDLGIGRFSVRTVAQLQAIINKTLTYEYESLPDPEYTQRAVFMASQDNYWVSEGTHNWVISNYMDALEFLSTRLYCATNNANTQQVRNAFNEGQVYGIYSGHGSNTSWADGPYFSQSDVNNLTNGGKYPLVWSFACITGTYTLTECFTETWMRAANKGAVTIIGSSVNSYWTEDDVLEKRLYDSIYDEDDAVPAQVAPVWNDTRLRYLGEMGSGSTTRRYYEMYNLLGDPSLSLPGVLGPPPPYGDYDRDRDIDLDDFAGYLLCETGPDAGPIFGLCKAMDTDMDGDVDHVDFCHLQEIFGMNAD